MTGTALDVASQVLIGTLVAICVCYSWVQSTLSCRARIYTHKGKRKMLSSPPEMTSTQQPMADKLHARFPEFTMTEIEAVVSESKGCESVAAAQLLALSERSDDRTKGHPAESILHRCTVLRQGYAFPWVWGRSGLIQTLLFTVVGRFNFCQPVGTRRELKLMDDGSTSTVDIYEPAGHSPPCLPPFVPLDMRLQQIP